MIKRRRYRPPCTYSGIFRALYPPDPTRDLSNLLPSPRYLTAHPHLWILGPPALPRPLRAPPRRPRLRRFFIRNRPALRPISDPSPPHQNAVTRFTWVAFAQQYSACPTSRRIITPPSPQFITLYFVFNPWTAI